MGDILSVKIWPKKKVSEGAILMNPDNALEMPLLARTKCISTCQATMVKDSVISVKVYDVWKTTVPQIWSRHKSLPPPHPLPCTHPFASPHWMDGPTDRWTDIPSCAEARTHLEIQAFSRAIYGTARHGTSGIDRLCPNAQIVIHIQMLVIVKRVDVKRWGSCFFQAVF